MQAMYILDYRRFRLDHSAHNHLIHMLSELDPLQFLGFVSIFSFSFISSLHCGFMCSPLVCSFMGPRAKPTSPGIWIYNLGRVLSYMIAGWLLGSFGENLSHLPSFGSWLAKILGLVLFTVGVIKLGKFLNFWNLDPELPSSNQRLFLQRFEVCRLVFVSSLSVPLLSYSLV